MSETARSEHIEARATQQTQNEARRIRIRVEAAQNNPARAGIRWPFELMQNAHDAGARNNSSQVEVKFVLNDSNLEVSHNGMPFTAQELTALLSSGSSKEFDSEETTGRFGTGFMVTHCLSARVDVSGIIKTEDGYEEFSINLDRAGDEESITANIQQAEIALANAKPLSEAEMGHIPTALFVYHEINRNTAWSGLSRLEETLPYLYATCDKLGQLQIERDQQTTVFESSNKEDITLEGFTLKQTDVTVSRDENTQRFVALRLSSKTTQAGLLVVLEQTDNNQYKVVMPTPRFPKVFVKFPIIGTEFLPFNVIIDGGFAPQQERDGIAMHANDRAIMKNALSALPSIVHHAVKSGWRDAHKLAKLAIPTQMLSGGNDTAELDWWKENIFEIANAMASKSIVLSEDGLLPALGDDGKIASFMVPAVDLDGHTPVGYDEIHDLASRVSDLFLPNKIIAQEWSEIATKWGELGLETSLFGLSELADHVKSHRSIEATPVEFPFKWLADLLLLVSGLPESINKDPIVSGLLPNQYSNLCRVRDLRIDDRIPEEIKDIATEVDIDLRAKLLHNDIMAALSESGYEPAKSLIQDLLRNPFAKTEAIDDIIAKLDLRLPADSKFDEESGLVRLRTSANLAKYLFLESDQRFGKCPLLTEDGSFARLESVQILAPVKSWPASYQPYAGLYTGTRLLSDLYCTDICLKESLPELYKSRRVARHPLGMVSRNLDANLLREMSPDSTDMTGVSISNQSFGTIAFFAGDLVNRCGNDRDIAKLLLDFVVNVAAKESQGWRETKTVTGNKAGKPVEVRLYGVAWPFELKMRNWVPIPVGEKGNESFAQAPANEANLRELLDYSWLKNNPDGIDFLHRVFGFKQLALMVENLEAEVEESLVTLLQDQDLVKSAVENLDAVKAAIENPEAVKLLSEAGADEIQQIRAEIQQRNEQAQMRERNRSFGHAVQVAVKEALESHGLDLVLVDRGFDYEVFPSLEEALFRFTVGSYFLEVKATISRDVRLTPMQAETAYYHRDRFVLCVVDLEGQQIKDVWEPADVLPHARIVTNIGGDVEEIYEGVDALANSGNPVRLRNEQMLRYGISPELWYNGLSIEEWVQSLARLEQG